MMQYWFEHADPPQLEHDGGDGGGDGGQKDGYPHTRQPL
jgi:hypothetical protein